MDEGVGRDFISPPANSPPSFRWVRWLAAGLTLLMLAFIFHTSGRVAALVRIKTRHWMRTTTRIPAPWHWPSLLVSHSKVLPLRETTWAPPLIKASLIRSFGWHGSGASARFEPGVVLKVTRHGAIHAGTSSRALSVSGQTITLAAGSYHIRFFPVSPRISSHAALLAAQEIGVAEKTRLTIDVTRAGYPLNPLSTSFYGSTWINP